MIRIQESLRVHTCLCFIDLLLKYPISFFVEVVPVSPRRTQSLYIPSELFQNFSNEQLLTKLQTLRYQILTKLLTLRYIILTKLQTHRHKLLTKLPTL